MLNLAFAHKTTHRLNILQVGKLLVQKFPEPEVRRMLVEINILNAYVNGKGPYPLDRNSFTDYNAQSHELTANDICKVTAKILEKQAQYAPVNYSLQACARPVSA